MKHVLLILLLLVPVVAAEQVVINSQDWRDVYTGMQYASLSGTRANFVVDPIQGADLSQRLGDDTDVLLITGDDPAMPGFRSLIQNRGYDVQEFQSGNPLETNYEFARRAQPTSAIVVDDAYGYGAVSVATYAKRIDASVLFAGPTITDVLDDINPETVLSYGHIPGLIVEDIEPYNPDVINNQDRFEDNFELIQRYQRAFPGEQLLLSNGEFIEASLIDGDAPLLFIGRQNVPDEVITFLQESGFRSAVLVGNALAPNAVYIKDQTDIGVFIKFAQGRDSRQYALDLFQIPIPRPEISITQAEYDPTRQSLLITFQNPGDVPTYFTPSFVAQDTFGTDEVVFLDAGTYKTLRYDQVVDGPLQYTVLFGAGPSSLDLILQGSIDVSQVTVQDRSELRFSEAWYDTRRGIFVVAVENTASVDAFALVELVDVRIGQDRLRIASKVSRVPAGTVTQVRIPADLSERDIERNTELSLEMFYGQRELSLINFEEATLAFEARTELFAWWMIALAVLVAVVLVWLVLRRRR